MRLRSLHRAYPSLHPSGVVHMVLEQLIIKAVTGACKLINGCSLALCSTTVSVVSAGICHRNEVNSIAWLYQRAQPNDSIHCITLNYITMEACFSRVILKSNNLVHSTLDVASCREDWRNGRLTKNWGRLSMTSTKRFLSSNWWPTSRWSVDIGREWRIWLVTRSTLKVKTFFSETSSKLRCWSIKKKLRHELFIFIRIFIPFLKLFLQFCYRSVFWIFSWIFIYFFTWYLLIY